jgi:hypothetical protein
MGYPHDQPWYPYIDINDCPRFSTCNNCTRDSCPVVEEAIRRYENDL